jgi:uncharacterized cupredoxin-like copper-binding protein
MIVLTGAVLLAACGGAAGPISTGSGPVQVTLSEFKVESSQMTFSRGVPYRLNVSNKGKINHEFMIVPPTGGHAMSMEDMDKMALAMIKADDLPGGATKTLDFTFPASTPPGKLEFVCFVPGHSEAGMRLTVEVK